MTREILEIGAFYSLEKHDVASFERYVAQLRSYYQDYKSHGLPDSPNRAHILGLNLLHLLAQNRLAEFHLELQLLNLSEIQTNDFLKFPVEYEECLMEGSYNKVNGRIFLGGVTTPMALKFSHHSELFVARIDLLKLSSSLVQIFKQFQNLPAPNYQFFVDLLNESIREQVASCMEASYQSMSVVDASKMLFMDPVKQGPVLKEYAGKRGRVG